jgi:hypothetical protein
MQLHIHLHILRMRRIGIVNGALQLRERTNVPNDLASTLLLITVASPHGLDLAQETQTR